MNLALDIAASVVALYLVLHAFNAMNDAAVVRLIGRQRFRRAVRVHLAVCLALLAFVLGGIWS